MKKFFYIILFFIYINTYIILPFNQLNSDLEKLINNNDINNIITSNSLLNLYTSIYMGNTPFKLLVKLYPYNNFFSFSPIPYVHFNLTKYLFYNPFLSKSLHRNKDINYKEEFREVTDIFYFITNEEDIVNIYDKKNTSQIKEDKYKSYLYLNCLLSNWHFSDNYTGYLGLGRNSSYYRQYHFIKELKAKSVINHSIWSLDFNASYKNYVRGNLIIGEYPHIYDPNKYKKENYYIIKLFNDNYNENNNNEWIFKIDNSYILKEGEVRTSSNYIKFIDIIFGLYFMQAPYFLFEQLKFLFFEKYFENKICQFQKVQKDNDEKIFIFCSKKNFGEIEKNFFPKIIFNIKNNSNLIQLELNYTDLFITKNDKIFFSIAFSLHDRQDMIKVGQIFLHKYKFVFDYDNEEIGLYISNNLNNRQNKEIMYIIFSIAFFGFIFFGYKKRWWCVDIMKKRKIKKR